MNFETRKDDSYPGRTDGVMGSGGSEMIMSAGMMDLDQEIMNDIIQAGSGDGSISHWIGMTSSGPTSLSTPGNSSGNGGGTHLYPEEILSESPPASHMELPAQASSSTASSYPRIRASPPSLSLAIPDSTLTTDVNSIMGTGPSLNLIQPTPNSATPRRKGKGTLELERVLGELVDMESASDNDMDHTEGTTFDSPQSIQYPPGVGPSNPSQYYYPQASSSQHPYTQSTLTPQPYSNIYTFNSLPQRNMPIRKRSKSESAIQLPERDILSSGLGSGNPYQPQAQHANPPPLVHHTSDPYTGWGYTHGTSYPPAGPPPHPLQQTAYYQSAAPQIASPAHSDMSLDEGTNNGGRQRSKSPGRGSPGRGGPGYEVGLSPPMDQARRNSLLSFGGHRRAKSHGDIARPSALDLNPNAAPSYNNGTFVQHSADGHLALPTNIPSPRRPPSPIHEAYAINSPPAHLQLQPPPHSYAPPPQTAPVYLPIHGYAPPPPSGSYYMSFVSAPQQLRGYPPPHYLYGRQGSYSSQNGSPQPIPQNYASVQSQSLSHALERENARHTPIDRSRDPSPAGSQLSFDGSATSEGVESRSGSGNVSAADGPRRRGKRGKDVDDGGITAQSKTTQATIEAALKRRAPGTEAKFKCDLCGETFTRRYNLRGHQRAHRNEKPFICSADGCEKSFARAHDCKRHELLHLGVRRYHCDPCKRDFVRLDALQRHHRTEIGQDCVKALRNSGFTIGYDTTIDLKPELL